ITFEVISPSSAVTLQYAPGGAPTHPQLVAFNNTITVGPTSGSSVATARFWVIYRTGTVNSVLPTQTLTVQDSTGTQSWTIDVIANTVARKTAAAALVLDRSGSMSEDRGDGQSKHTSLQQAASIFVDTMLEGDGVGIVRFNENAQQLQSILPLGSGGLSDINRSATKDIINGNGLDPAGQTSIGDGIFEGRAILNNAPTNYDVDALVVLSDGIENQARWIADVAPEINEFTYAVGLGQPQNISVPALQTISGNNGGYLLVTGAIGTDNRFLLQKYFLQILAGISNAEIVLDPDGHLMPGRVERVPFQLTTGDAGVDVILLTPNTNIVDFRVQAPNGYILEPWRAMSEAGMRFVLSDNVSYYRFALPTELVQGRFDHAGTWHALMTIGRPRLERSHTADGVDHSVLRGAFVRNQSRVPMRSRAALAQRAAVLATDSFAAAPNARASAVGTPAPRTAPYSLIVHAYSNVSMRAQVGQSSFEPGARVSLSASLAQSGIPMTNGADVWAEVTRPDGSQSSLPFTARLDHFTAEMQTTLPGVYRFRVRARGMTQRAEPFTREQTLTAAVWRGGDRPGGSGPGSGSGGSNGGGGGGSDLGTLCKLALCMLQRDGVISSELEKRLREAGLDLDHARECLEKMCRNDCKC
ncbi:MAG TPA: vWA domain-containing protein, partial [Steroidobacteraceae bacterium]|nr:vWA domain-containing protein [Steroidobacteraceae bacterium]